MERKKEDRSLLIYMLLSVVTCGIYGLIFMWSFTNDLNDVSSAKDPDGWRSPNFIIVILLMIVTCGIYSWYWLYKVGNTIQRSGDDYGVRVDESGTTLILWCLLLGVGVFISYHFYNI